MKIKRLGGRFLLGNSPAIRAAVNRYVGRPDYERTGMIAYHDPERGWYTATREAAEKILALITTDAPPAEPADPRPVPIRAISSLHWT